MSHSLKHEKSAESWKESWNLGGKAQFWVNLQRIRETVPATQSKQGDRKQQQCEDLERSKGKQSVSSVNQQTPENFFSSEQQTTGNSRQTLLNNDKSTKCVPWNNSRNLLGSEISHTMFLCMEQTIYINQLLFRKKTQTYSSWLQKKRKYSTHPNDQCP